jgi:Asp/Glu/hydantoin racemase
VLRPWYAECVAWHGLGERCASIRALDDPFSSVSAVQEEKEELLLALARRAIEEDGADVVIPAGTPLAGLARRIRHLIDVPVVDLVGSAVRQAEVMAALAHRVPAGGTFQRPPAKESTGLAVALAARFARTDE